VAIPANNPGFVPEYVLIFKIKISFTLQFQSITYQPINIKHIFSFWWLHVESTKIKIVEALYIVNFTGILISPFTHWPLAREIKQCAKNILME
jgi:hypothetical protein